MTIRIIEAGCTRYQAKCHACGAKFSYEREDVHHNYVRGGEWVTCPTCYQPHRHFGISGITWP